MKPSFRSEGDDAPLKKAKNMEAFDDNFPTLG
jgi:hypothetical protein